MSVIFDLPELSDIAKRRTAINENRRKFIARSTEAQERFDRDYRAYMRKLDEALLSGQEPPKAPDPDAYSVDGHLDVFKRAAEQLDHEETQILARHGDRLREQLVDEDTKVWQRIAPHIAAIHAAAGELEQIRQAHRRLDNALGVPDTVYRSQPITAASLITGVPDTEPEAPRITIGVGRG